MPTPHVNQLIYSVTDSWQTYDFLVSQLTRVAPGSEAASTRAELAAARERFVAAWTELQAEIRRPDP